MTGFDVPFRSELIVDYTELVEALKQRRVDLGLSTMDLEEIAGLTAAHVTKLENFSQPGYGRSFGRVSLPLWLAGLGVGLMLVELPPDHPFHRAPKPPSERSKFRKKSTALPDHWNAA